VDHLAEWIVETWSSSKLVPMTKTEVLALLEENRDARGEANWKGMGDRTGGLASFGSGLTRLRAIAKQVGRDPIGPIHFSDGDKKCEPMDVLYESMVTVPTSRTSRPFRPGPR
jgi:hypothetical protein